MNPRDRVCGRTVVAIGFCVFGFFGFGIVFFIRNLLGAALVAKASGARRQPISIWTLVMPVNRRGRHCGDGFCCNVLLEQVPRPGTNKLCLVCVYV